MDARQSYLSRLATLRLDVSSFSTVLTESHHCCALCASYARPQPHPRTKISVQTVVNGTPWQTRYLCDACAPMVPYCRHMMSVPVPRYSNSHKTKHAQGGHCNLRERSIALIGQYPGRTSGEMINLATAAQKPVPQNHPSVVSQLFKDRRIAAVGAPYRRRFFTIDQFSQMQSRRLIATLEDLLHNRQIEQFIDLVDRSLAQPLTSANP